MLQKFVFPVIICIFLVFLFQFLLISHLGTHTTSANDGPLIIWLINQSSNAWTGEGSWYDWAFFYPYHYTATYSDPFITTGFLLTFLRPLTSNPVLQHNLFILFGTITNFFAFYILALVLWKKKSSAVLSAMVFTFSYLQLQFMVHLHSYLICGIPLGLWALIQYLRIRKLRYACFLSLAFIAQALNSPFTAYVFAALLLTYVWSEGHLPKLITNKPFFLTILFSVAICVWYYLPYALTADLYQAARTIRDTAHFSFPISRLSWPDVLIPLLFGSIPFWLGKNPIVSPLLRKRTWILMVVISGLALLGPVVKLGSETLKIFSLPIPLPYAAAYYLIPGIQAFRAVTRWSIGLNFGLALGVGWRLSQTGSSQKYVMGFIGIWLFSMLWLNYKNFPLFAIAATPPPIYSEVANTSGEALAEFPILQWDMVPFEGIEDERLLYQLHHKKKLYNGFSGFMPPQRREDIIFHFSQFPEEPSLKKITDAGVELLLVHFDEYQAMNEYNFNYYGNPTVDVHDLKIRVNSSAHLKKIVCTQVPDDCLYRLF